MRGSEFWAGYDAHHQGKPGEACPHPAGSLQAANWIDGWGSDAASIMNGIANDARLVPGFDREQSHKTVMVR